MRPKPKKEKRKKERVKPSFVAPMHIFVFFIRQVVSYFEQFIWCLKDEHVMVYILHSTYSLIVFPCSLGLVK